MIRVKNENYVENEKVTSEKIDLFSYTFHVFKILYYKCLR